jgi:hypothetical protein
MTKEWLVNGQFHREDGPAIEWANGRNDWYVNGVHCSEQEYPSTVIQFKLNCNRETAEVILELYKY